MTLCAQHSQPKLQHIPSTSVLIASNVTNMMRGKAFFQREVEKKRLSRATASFNASIRQKQRALDT